MPYPQCRSVASPLQLRQPRRTHGEGVRGVLCRRRHGASEEIIMIFQFSIIYVGSFEVSETVAELSEKWANLEAAMPYDSRIALLA